MSNIATLVQWIEHNPETVDLLQWIVSGFFAVLAFIILYFYLPRNKKNKTDSLINKIDMLQKKLEFIHAKPSNVDKLQISSTQKKDLKHVIQLLADGKLEKAEDVLTKDYKNIVDSQEAFSFIHFLRGNIYYERGKLRKAINLYTAAIALNQKFSAAYFNKANALAEIELHEDALVMYDKALALDPCDISILYNRGITLYDMGFYEEAIEMYDAVLFHDQNNEKALYNKGNALYDIEKYKEAVEVYDLLIKKSPQHEAAYFNKATTLWKIKEYDAAIDAFLKVVQMSPKDAAAHYYLACLYADMKKNEQSKERLQIAIDLDSKYKEEAQKESYFCHALFDDILERVQQ